MGACASKLRHRMDEMDPSDKAPEPQPSMERVEPPATVTSAAVVDEKRAGGGGGREGDNEVEKEEKPKVLVKEEWLEDQNRRRSLAFLLYMETDESEKSTMDKSTSEVKVLDKEPVIEGPQDEVAMPEVKDSYETPSRKRSKEVGAELPEVECSMKSVHEKSYVNEKDPDDAEIKIVGVETTLQSIQVEDVAEKPSTEYEKKEVKEEQYITVTSSTETNTKEVEEIIVEKSTHIEGISVSNESGKDPEATVVSEAPEVSVEQAESHEEVETSVKDVKSESVVIEKNVVVLDVKIDEEFKQQVGPQEDVETSVKDMKSESVVIEKNDVQDVKIDEEFKQVGPQEDVETSVKDLKSESVVIEKNDVVQDVKLDEEFKQRVGPQEDLKTSAKDVKSDILVTEKKEAIQDVKTDVETKLKGDATEEATVSEPVKEPREEANTDARQQVSTDIVS